MEASSSRLRPLLRTLFSRSSQLQIQLQAPRRFASSAPLSWRAFSDDSEEDVYRDTLKSQRPCITRWQKGLENSVSFIGTVDRPLTPFKTRSGISTDVYTSLKVKSSSQANNFFWILLVMKKEMAEISTQHLKPNDFIYVSGHLESNEKADENGNLRLWQKVIVKEINYVANNGEKIEHSGDSRESSLEKRRKRLHLWQVFFVNPYEWQDLRKCKTNPRQPDFKHKGTGEALWLTAYDPPWVRRQLQLQDSIMRENGLERDRTYHSYLSPLSYNDW